MNNNHGQMLKYFAQIRTKKDTNQSMTKVEKILWLKINKGMDSQEALNTLERTNNFFNGTWQERDFSLPENQKTEIREIVEIEPEFSECRCRDIPNLVMHFFKSQESSLIPETKYYRAWDHKKQHAIYKLDTGETCIFENSGVKPSWAESPLEEIIVQNEPIHLPPPPPITVAEIPYCTPEVEMMTSGTTSPESVPERINCHEFIECNQIDLPALVIHHFAAQECPITENTKFYRKWDHDRHNAVYKLCSGETCVFENTGAKPCWAHY